MMLNFLEQAPLYNAINFSMEGRGSDYASAANSSAYNAKISVFLCPSDPNGGRVNDNCYYGSVGPDDQRRQRRPAPAHEPGLPQLHEPDLGRVRVPPGLRPPRHHRRHRRTRSRSPRARRGPGRRPSPRAT